MSILVKSAVSLVLVILINGCASFSQHQFAEPVGGWQTQAGQLLFRSDKARLIGDVIVRYSTAGDFELIFSKGPGLTLLTIREDPSYAQVNGALAQHGWSGTIDRAPAQLRGWLELRDRFARAPAGKSFHYKSGTDTFDFRF